jgi:hypothetical protein
LGKIVEQLTAWAVFKHEEELALRGEGVVHLYHKGVTH